MIHGGDIWSFAKEQNIEPHSVIDLSSNINFVKPKIDIDLNRVDTSPYPTYREMEDKIKILYGLKDIELFNGATTAISSLFRDIEPSEVVIYAPAYGEYLRTAQLMGVKSRIINRLRDELFDVPFGSMVIFVNPSTPDGVYYELDELMEYWISRECSILIDESFLQFTDFKSLSNYIESYERVYILKSMTKYYGSAGVRVGVVASSEIAIKRLKSKEPLWKISELDCAFILSALRDTTFDRLSRDKNREAKDFLIKSLESSSLIERVYHSDVNFLLARLNSVTGEEFNRLISTKNIMVRECYNFHGLDNRYIRVAVKSIDDLRNLTSIILF